MDDWADISDNLTVMGPGVLNCVISADTSSSGITRWAKPMVLWGTGCACPHALISSAVDGFSENSVGEDGIVGDDSGCEVMGNTLTDIEDSINLSVAVFCNNLEGSKEFGR